MPASFGGITEALSGEALAQKFQLLQMKLTEFKKFFDESIVELSDGACASREDVSLLTAVYEWLTERFSRQLSLLRSRPGRS